MSESARPSPDGLDVHLAAHLRALGVAEVAPRSMFATLDGALQRRWRTALARAAQCADRHPADLRAWSTQRLVELARAPLDDKTRSTASEVDAALRLSWVASVKPVPRTKKRRTPDFRAAGWNVEVSCPGEHVEEREVAEAELATAARPADGAAGVAVSRTHPTIGSGRAVVDGRVTRKPDSNPLRFPANKLADRMLGNKRKAVQFPEGEKNLLWLDLKHGLEMSVIDCVPLRSVVVRGSCFVATHGVWHAFYGELGSRQLGERSTLEYPGCLRAYVQQPEGWFREQPKMSGAVLSLVDGVVLLENPWSTSPFDDTERATLLRLPELRPEGCWLGPSDELATMVKITLRRIDSLASTDAAPDSSSA